MFKYQPQWQGPLSGRSFEKQTEDFLNGIESRVDEIDTRQTPSDAVPMAPGVGFAGVSEEYSRGDHSHPLQSSVSGNAGTADALSEAREISMSGEGSGSAFFNGTADVIIPLSVSCIATDSTVRRSIADRFAEAANVRDFGAAGDGVTDDTAAIQSAIATGKTVFFPEGIYSCQPVAFSVPVTMSENAVLKYNGDGSDAFFITIAVDNLVFGDIYIDCNAKEIKAGLVVTGDGNYFRTVYVKNLTSAIRLTVGVLVLGSDNTIDSILLKDLVNTGYWNDSSPQGLTLEDPDDGECTGNVFSSVQSANGRSTVVNASTGTNFFADVFSYNCHDNGFYAVDTGMSVIDTIYYDGDDNPAGFRHGANAQIGHIYAVNNSSSVFFGNCGDICINSCCVSFSSSSIQNPLAVNQTLPDDAGEKQGAGRIVIGKLCGSIGYGRAVFMPEDINGAHQYIESLTIGEIDLCCKYDASVSANRSSWFRVDAAREIHIGRANIKVEVTDQETGTDRNLYATVNSALERQSDFYGLTLNFVLSNGTASSVAYAVYLSNFAQARLAVLNGEVNASNLLFYNANSNFYSRMVAPSAPTGGTWVKGQVLWSTQPAANAVGWVCSVSGTPGTWVAF